jgi:hypothetical protein
LAPKSIKTVILFALATVCAIAGNYCAMAALSYAACESWPVDDGEEEAVLFALEEKRVKLYPMADWSIEWPDMILVPLQQGLCRNREETQPLPGSAHCAGRAVLCQLFAYNIEMVGDHAHADPSS